MKNHDYYFAKLVVSGKTSELYVYRNVQIKQFDLDNEDEIEKEININEVNEDEEIEENEINEQKQDNDNLTDEEKELRTEKSMQRTKRNLRRIINSNVNMYDEKDKMLTLTFKENIQDIKYANNELKKFIKRLRYYLKKKNKSNDFKYICVPEIQDGSRRKDKQGRGAIHFHVLFFGLPYIMQCNLQDLWGNGIVDIRKLDDKNDIGNYLCTYLTKENYQALRLKNSKSYYSSRGLLKEEILYFKDEIEAYQYVIANGGSIQFETQFASEYVGQIQYAKYVK